MNSLRKGRAALWLLASVLGVVLSGCGGGSGKAYTPPALTDGVIFTYPINGQSDVPLGTRFYVTFSKNANASAVAASCSVSGGSLQEGNFCLLDEAGNVVSIDVQVNGKTVQFESMALRQGQRYRLFVRDAVMGGSSNLSASEPLLSFTTSQIDPVSGTLPAVTAINGEHPDVYRTIPTPPAVRPAARYPFMDFASLRVEFSEPLNESTVQVGSSFQFVQVDADGSEIPVDGALIVRKRHVVFDPAEDLQAGATYRLHLSNDIQDLNGERLAATSFELVPEDSNACNCVMKQYFKTSVAYGESGFPATSVLTGQRVNAIDLYSPLIGANDIFVLSSTLEAELADPAGFGGLIPFVIRKGNFLEITGLDLQLGGAVPADLRTGTIRATFLSDATGFLGRNPYRGADVRPDDAKAPVFVYLNFDLALTATDDKGNAVLNQTIPHVQATGIARVVNGQLQIETVRTLTLDLLGLDLAPGHMVLAIHSDLNGSKPADSEAPRLTGTYPADGSRDFAPTDAMSLIFSKPIDNAGLVAGEHIRLLDMNNGGADVPFQISYDGSTVLLKPDSPLNNNRRYQIQIDALQDVNGNALATFVDDASGGDGVIEFFTENPPSTGSIGPMVSSIYPGAACLLASETDRRCAGGDGGDTPYASFVMPADGYLDVQFNQQINPGTLTLGTSCNTGSVRVERLNTSNSCDSIVPGTLTVDSRSIRFKPTQPWENGVNYRLTLVSGNDATCSAGEICGRNGLPLNPDPLRGAKSGDAGSGNSTTNDNRNLTIRFQGEAARGGDAVYLPLKLEPYTDSNGNGAVDATESGRIENSARVTVTATGGIIGSASVVGDSRIYLNGSLPVTVGLPEVLDVDGADWGMTIESDLQIPVHIHPGILYGTSIRINPVADVSQLDLLGMCILPVISAICDSLADLPEVPTGLNVLRLRETGGQPVKGYIVQEAGLEQPQFIAKLDLYMDAPDMTVLSGLAGHDLKSKLLPGVTVKGPITFMPDGRIVIELVNVKPVDLQVMISALGGNIGWIGLQIPKETMQLRLIGEPLKGRR